MSQVFQSPVERPEIERTKSDAGYRPNVDIIEENDALILYADMPGTKSENVDVAFENGKLTIHGRVDKRQQPDVCYLLREYGSGDFIRTFEISEDIDSARISAEYSNGVLKLILPKSEAVKPRKISVKSAV